MYYRPVKTNDLESIYYLNESVLPHVNSISHSTIEKFMRISSFFMVAKFKEEIAGFMIALGPGQDYKSENYIFFSKKYKSFEYVDRIVVKKKYEGMGIGRGFYEYLIKQSNAERITCEVNLHPPNPNSILFHQKVGFKEIAQLYIDGRKKKVSLMTLKI